MSSQPDTPSLSSLEFIHYLDDRGHLPEFLQGKIGVYAIFDQQQMLQYVGYSRDIHLSLKQQLVRQPECCYWLKVQTIDRPNRTILEEIRTTWISENGSVPAGNGVDEGQWTQAIDAKLQMTPEEQASLVGAIDELTQTKVLKQVARRVEAEILEVLKSRGVQVEIRFNPKLKEEGLLDLK
ncbi:MAG: GIY-YIG nuclease family protein [Stenomitos rutilans HA7619-LM2]|jgi:hypothetical protein|nr:GIY-YIG nuclease family protein [Stenomitos rutilans HA7619-LM2]